MDQLVGVQADPGSSQARASHACFGLLTPTSEFLVLQVEERQAREFRRASMTIEDIRRARQPINPAPRRTHTYMKIMLVTPQAELIS